MKIYINGTRVVKYFGDDMNIVSVCPYKIFYLNDTLIWHKMVFIWNCYSQFAHVLYGSTIN